MKQTFTLLSFLSLFICIGCKKEADIDPRDQYLGRYDLVVTSAITIANTSSPPIMSTSTDFLYIKKGEQAAELQFISSRRTLIATLREEGKFDIAPQTIKSYRPNTGVEYTQLISGEGAFANSQIKLKLTAKMDFVATQSKEEMVINGTKLP